MRIGENEKVILLTHLLLLLQSWIIAQPAARFDTVFTNYFRRTSQGWKAGDGTISVPLPDGRVIWLFGDSHLDPLDTIHNTLSCLFQIRNCMTIQDSVRRNSFNTIIDSIHTGVNQTPFKLVLNDTTLFWPDHGYAWNDTVYLFMERVGNTVFGKFYGEYVAKLYYPDLHLIGIYPLHSTNDIRFGKSVLIDTASNYLYLYGNKLNWVTWEPYLARCKLNNLNLPWEYYTGSGWSSLPVQAQKISSLPVSPNYSVIQHNGKYYLITQQNGYLRCGQGREIYSYESATPSGPFANKRLLYTEESKINGKYLVTYNAQAHPFFTENNEILISYNVNNGNDSATCFIQCANIFTDRMEADSYRPKFIRVPFGIMDGSLWPNVPEITAHAVPNPVHPLALFTCEIKINSPGELIINMLDSYGRVVFVSKKTGSWGENNLQLLAPATKGVYFISILLKNNETVFLKLIVC